MENRFERQEALVPRGRLAGLSVDVIGVGAIGRQAALQLAALGAAKMRLIDFDRVEPTNLTTQGYLAADLGETKVAATVRQVQSIDPAIDVTPVCDRYRASLGCSPVVFCCVDSIAARAAIWRSVRDHCEFWCDSRMLGEVVRVLTADCPHGRDHYDRSLFPQAEAQRGRCTATGTIYTANIAAGLMVHQFTRWLRSIQVDIDTTVNLLAGELSTALPHNHRS